VAGYYRRRGFAVDPDSILLTASTSEAYSYLFKLFCDPGDAVLVPQPSYPLFDHLAALEGVRAIPYPLFFDGRWLAAPFETPGGAIVAVSPNNPTGSLADIPALRRLGLPLIVDEVFADYAPAAPRYDGVFYLNGLSKAAGLPQMKLGWIVFPPAHRAALEWIADSYLSVSAPVQFAAPAWLARITGIQSQIRDRCAENQRWLRAFLAGTAVTPLPIDGGWTVPLEIPRTRPEEEVACSLLQQQGVLVQPGYFYDFPREAYLVVSLLPPPAIFAEGVRRLAGAIC
jgi:aspartate/methionine/tyrosine aminotransferase